MWVSLTLPALGNGENYADRSFLARRPRAWFVRSVFARRRKTHHSNDAASGGRRLALAARASTSSSSFSSVVSHTSRVILSPSRIARSRPVPSSPLFLPVMSSINRRWMNQSINRSRPVCSVDPRRDAPRSEPSHRGLERARSHR